MKYACKAADHSSAVLLIFAKEIQASGDRHALNLHKINIQLTQTTFSDNIHIYYINVGIV